VAYFSFAQHLLFLQKQILEYLQYLPSKLILESSQKKLMQMEGRRPMERESL